MPGTWARTRDAEYQSLEGDDLLDFSPYEKTGCGSGPAFTASNDHGAVALFRGQQGVGLQAELKDRPLVDWFRAALPDQAVLTRLAAAGLAPTR